MSLSFADLARQAASAPVSTTGVIPPLKAGTYKASMLSLTSAILMTSSDAAKTKNPNTAYLRCGLRVTVDDPALTEANIPARDINKDLLTSFIKSGNMAFVPQNITLPDESVLTVGLSQDGNTSLWNLLGRIFSFTGLATAENDNTKFSYGEDSRFTSALHLSDLYLKNGEALMNNENPLDTKGVAITEQKLHQFVLPHNQLVALNALLVEEVKNYKLQFKVEVICKAPRDEGKQEENEIVGLWLLANDEETSLL